jgi:hypothetical protein
MYDQSKLSELIRFARVDAGSTVRNSIIADNPVKNCVLTNNSSLSVTGTNLSTDASCPNFTYNNTPSNLAPLGNNDGPTPTHLPLANSMAIDTVTDCTRVDLTVVADDQRGEARPQQGRTGDPILCDIGAVEHYDRIFANGFE